MNNQGVDIGSTFGFRYFHSLGDAVSVLVPPLFSIAGAAVILYFLLGAFKWLTSSGDKNELATAQQMITHSIIGFVLLMFTFVILQFLLWSLFGIKGLKLI